MLTVDSREPVEIDHHFRDGGMETLHRTKLDVGDYMWYDADEALILLSRKASDYTQSIFSGHLEDELERCIEAIHSYGSGRLIFLLEGKWTSGYGDGKRGLANFRRQGPRSFVKRFESRAGYLTHVGMQASMLAAGISFVETGSLQETAVMIASLYRRAQDGWPTSLGSRMAPPTVKLTNDDTVRRLLAIWPRLRERQAIELLAFYGSIGEIVKVAREIPEALFARPGIGDGLIKNFQEVIE